MRTDRQPGRDQWDADANVVRLVPGGGLQAHEGVEGGHALATHVGKSVKYLRHRLATEPQIDVVSTFYDREVAEHSISALLRANQGEIGKWLTASKRELVLTGRAERPIGIVIEAESNEPQQGSGLRLLIRRSPALGIGFRVHTAMVTL